MRERVCKNCGGRQYKAIGQNMVKCQFCGTLYVDEQASKEEEILLVSANEKLRDAKFEQAIVEFDKILSIYPNSFEAFFGKSLAKNKIVFYTNKKGNGKKPRYFGAKIPQILLDEDFQAAINCSPEEIKKEYSDIAKKIERDAKKYCELDKTKPCDVVIFQMDNDNIDKTEKLVEKLNSKKIGTYFLQGLETKESEAETFFALSSSKVLLLVANKKNGYNDSDIKNLVDRYRYYISQRQKFSMGFVIVYDNNIITKENLPQELGFCKNYVDFNSKNFVDYMVANIQTIIEKTPQEVAKIETRKVEKVDPVKKEYVDIENIIPTELGHYKVQNVEAKDAIKTKWIFISLKNADFEATKKLIEAELEKDPNNAEMLFAQMLCEKNLRTAGEFFESISNFDNKEKIDNILKYSTKEFAEMFVDNWEKLIENLGSEDYYNTYLLYLAKFETPNREHFIDQAEIVAIETLNEELIDKVLKCFKKEEVDKFVKFYFELAQKSDNQKYYDKILEIDEGHKQSNMALLLRNFKTDKDKLEFRDREKIEESLKFLDEGARSQFAFAVINLVIPVAFLDLKKAEEQIDFYLSYVKQSDYEIPMKIAQKLVDINAFRLAEKYLAVAISRNEENAKLYWELLKIKAHCKSDSEIITSPIDLSQFPEWQTLLNYADDEQTEQYAEIVSKSHLYKGKRKQVATELLDKGTLIEKLTDFINRNNKILISSEEENGIGVLKGCEYFRVQLSPFEDYLNIVKEVETFDEYVSIVGHIIQRLFFLDLTLDGSISVIQINDKSEGLKNVEFERKLATKPKKEKRKKEGEKTPVDPELVEKRKKFWKWFAFGFFEVFPVAFLTILLTIIIINPKDVYAYFPQKSVLFMLLYSVIIGFGNLIYYIAKKKKFNLKKKLLIGLLMVFAFLNVILLSIGFYLVGKNITVANANEFELYANNACYANIELTDNIDFEGKEISVGDYYGCLDGKGYSISNLAFKENSNVALFQTNYGVIRNLNINLSDKTYKNISNFAIIAIKNYGVIENCKTNGNVKIYANDSLNCAGITAIQCDGDIKNCVENAVFKVFDAKNTVKLGKIAAVVNGQSRFIGNTTTGSFTVSGTDCKQVYFGGVAGYVEEISSHKFEKNASKTNIIIDAKTENVAIGGLFGFSPKSCKNSYAEFECYVFDTTNGNIGGLYGVFNSYNPSDAIEHCYANIVNLEYYGSAKCGGLVGGDSGSIKNCYTNVDLELIAGTQLGLTQKSGCQNTITGYKKSFGFSSEIWNGVGSDSGNFPTLK